jgi:hypothetical protein
VNTFTYLGCVRQAISEVQGSQHVGRTASWMHHSQASGKFFVNAFLFGVHVCAGQQMEHILNFQGGGGNFLNCSLQWREFNFCVDITFLTVAYIYVIDHIIVITT